MFYHVLQKMNKMLSNQGIENASDAVIDYLDHGFNHAMNRFN